MYIQFLKLLLFVYLIRSIMKTSAKSIFINDTNTTLSHYEYSTTKSTANSTILVDCIKKKTHSNVTTKPGHNRKKRNNLPVTSHPNTDNETSCIKVPTYDPEFVNFQIGIGIFLISVFILFFVYMHFGKDQILNFLTRMRLKCKKKFKNSFFK